MGDRQRPFLLDGLVSGIGNHASRQAAEAIAAIPINPGARPRLPATRPERVVLSKAPAPDIVPRSTSEDTSGRELTIEFAPQELTFLCLLISNLWAVWLF